MRPGGLVASPAASPGWRLAATLLCARHGGRIARPRRPDRLRAGPRGPREQPQGRRPRGPARRAGGVHGGLGVGQVVAGVRHVVRRGPAALPRVGGSVRAAVVRPDAGAAGRQHRGSAAGGGVAAAARRRDLEVVGRRFGNEFGLYFVFSIKANNVDHETPMFAGLAHDEHTGRLILAVLSFDGTLLAKQDFSLHSAFLRGASLIFVGGNADSIVGLASPSSEHRSVPLEGLLLTRIRLEPTWSLGRSL